MNKWVSADADITPRFIYNLIRTKASVLIKQQIDKRRLLNSDSIHYIFECIDLVKVSSTECGIPGGKTYRRSKDKLPKLEEGIYTYTIQGVYNIDNSLEFKPTTLRALINKSKLRIQTNDIFYLIKDEYLYITDEELEAANMYYFTTDALHLLKECQSAYDMEFKFPAFLEDALFKMVYDELQVYHASRKDTTQDNNDQGT